MLATRFNLASCRTRLLRYVSNERGWMNSLAEMVHESVSRGGSLTVARCYLYHPSPLTFNGCSCGCTDVLAHAPERSKLSRWGVTHLGTTPESIWKPTIIIPTGTNSHNDTELDSNRHHCYQVSHIKHCSPLTDPFQPTAHAHIHTLSFR